MNLIKTHSLVLRRVAELRTGTTENPPCRGWWAPEGQTTARRSATGLREQMQVRRRRVRCMIYNRATISSLHNLIKFIFETEQAQPKMVRPGGT